MTSESVAMLCADADELAGLYVLGALDAAEEEQVRLHLVTCANAHPLFAEVGSVVPALFETIEPIEPPAELRDRVLTAVAATRQPASDSAAASTRAMSRVVPAPMAAVPARPAPEPISLAAERQRRASRSWLQPVLAAAAVLLIVVLGATTLMFQRQATDAEARASTLRSAIAASLDTRSAVATLRGSGVAASASGFAAFPADGGGYIVINGLPATDAQRAYQAWFLADGKPYSAGLLSVGSDGLAIAQGVPMMQGASAVALTIEPAAGSAAPTSDPVMLGEMHTGPTAVTPGELALR